MSITQHLAEIEKMADAFAAPDGTERVQARMKGVPPELALAGLQLMRRSFCVGALAASGLLWEGNPDVPVAWLKRNGIIPDLP